LKKYLLEICGIIVIASLVGCGDSDKNSSTSTSINETNSAEETIVTTTATKTNITEELREDEEITLDSELECDYMKIATCSKWKEKSEMIGETFYAFLDWGDVDEGPYYFIKLELTKTTLGEMSQLDLQEYYEGFFKYLEKNNEENNNIVLGSFEKNGQAYIIIGSDESRKDLIRMIHFSTDTIEGHFTYSSECEDILMDMIDSIEFKESAKTITETVTSSVSKEYSNALKKADSYANKQHMSKTRLYDQLTSEYGEHFSEDAANYAIENVVTDYNQNALMKADSYANNQYMSKSSLYNQLISEYGEGFTESEAQYAVDNVETDYNYNALQKAISYQENQSMSKERIYEQLVSEYGERFTPEEAQYAIDNLE